MIYWINSLFFSKDHNCWSFITAPCWPISSLWYPSAEILFVFGIIPTALTLFGLIFRLRWYYCWDLRSTYHELVHYWFFPFFIWFILSIFHHQFQVTFIFLSTRNSRLPNDEIMSQVYYFSFMFFLSMFEAPFDFFRQGISFCNNNFDHLLSKKWQDFRWNMSLYCFLLRTSKCRPEDLVYINFSITFS